MARNVCVDFDGVIHSYTGWTGGDISGKPVDGAFAFLDSLLESGYHVVILSARASDKEQRTLMAEWFSKNGYGNLDSLEITAVKPPAEMYIDDKAWAFTGSNFPSIDDIRNFKPWWQKEKAMNDNIKIGEMIANASNVAAKSKSILMSFSDDTAKANQRLKDQVARLGRITDNSSPEEISQELNGLIMAISNAEKMEGIDQSILKSANDAVEKLKLIADKARIETVIKIGNDIRETGDMLNSIPKDKRDDNWIVASKKIDELRNYVGSKTVTNRQLREANNELSKIHYEQISPHKEDIEFAKKARLLQEGIEQRRQAWMENKAYQSANTFNSAISGAQSFISVIENLGGDTRAYKDQLQTLKAAADSQERAGNLDFSNLVGGASAISVLLEKAARDQMKKADNDQFKKAFDEGPLSYKISTFYNGQLTDDQKKALRGQSISTILDDAVASGEMKQSTASILQNALRNNRDLTGRTPDFREADALVSGALKAESDANFKTLDDPKAQAVIVASYMFNPDIAAKQAEELVKVQALGGEYFTNAVNQYELANAKRRDLNRLNDAYQTSSDPREMNMIQSNIKKAKSDLGKIESQANPQYVIQQGKAKVNELKANLDKANLDFQKAAAMPHDPQHPDKVYKARKEATNARTKASSEYASELAKSKALEAKEAELEKAGFQKMEPIAAEPKVTGLPVVQPKQRGVAGIERDIMAPLSPDAGKVPGHTELIKERIAGLVEPKQKQDEMAIQKSSGFGPRVGESYIKALDARIAMAKSKASDPNALPSEREVASSNAQKLQGEKASWEAKNIAYDKQREKIGEMVAQQPMEERQVSQPIETAFMPEDKTPDISRLNPPAWTEKATVASSQTPAILPPIEASPALQAIVNGIRMNKSRSEEEIASMVRDVKTGKMTMKDAIDWAKMTPEQQTQSEQASKPIAPDISSRQQAFISGISPRINAIAVPEYRKILLDMLGRVSSNPATFESEAKNLEQVLNQAEKKQSDMQAQAQQTTTQTAGVNAAIPEQPTNKIIAANTGEQNVETKLSDLNEIDKLLKVFGDDIENEKDKDACFMPLPIIPVPCPPPVPIPQKNEVVAADVGTPIAIDPATAKVEKAGMVGFKCYSECLSDTERERIALVVPEVRNEGFPCRYMGLADDKKNKCPESGCVQKVNSKWRVYSGRTGKLWPQVFDTEESAKGAIAGYHINK